VTLTFEFDLDRVKFNQRV